VVLRNDASPSDGDNKRGVFAISAAHRTYQNYLEEPPNPCETSERMNFNVIDKKQLI
jgi:hypothetical protein